MVSEVCEALREVEIGRLKISDFAPPEVFSSGLFNQYSLTIADLRWHLTECDECGASMAAALGQLADFDLDRLTAFGAALDCFDSALVAQLDWLRGESDFLGELVARESEWDKGEPAARAGLADFWSDQVFEENRDTFFLAAIRVHAFLGERIARWLETLLPPAIPRARVVRGHEIVDVRISPDRVDAAQVPDLSSLLTGDEKVAAFLLRSLLLREAFGNLAAKPGDELIERECAAPKLLEPQTEESQRLGWRTIWEHYTELARMKAERLCQIRGVAEPTDSRIAEQLDNLKALVKKSGEAQNEKLDSLLYGQTAIMASQQRLENAVGPLVQAYKTAPQAAKDECLAAVRNELGPLFDRLTDNTHLFLVSAEYHYRHTPADLDFSSVLVLLSKGFEAELRRALEPLGPQLQELVDSDSRWKGGKVKESTLGQIAWLFGRHSGEVSPLLERRGVVLDEVLAAIDRVNAYRGAKHPEAMTRAEATSCRALFLGTPSVLAALCPPRKTE
jgi:hypothetical protein